ncbi:hypothetical protein BV22DRAFT_1107565 [Leucogyrophana mollusca]|uniref:Uncharacterized protein n=1 Tax=Leucogyrophana mollusca TaxID=85980 RepID=A0ACB8B595_9AGAM|nr:hypothetical protein BV22DRAFT_1107565 [Leucogyrophana mollusca]
MLACRRRLLLSPFLSARCLSTPSSSEAPPSQKNDSIFSNKSSPWDHVFDDIKDTPPLLPSSVRNPLRAAAGPSITSAPGRARRQAMTAREVNAFDEMFNMIFNAVSEQKHSSDKDPLSSSGIGRLPQGGRIGDLFGNLRKQSKRLKWTTQSDEELDRKREEMDMCDTDQQLLEWAMREVFAESQKYEAAARNANATTSSTPPQLQPTTYPHLVALLMRTFRDKYRDPHLALSVFEYTRHLSIPSYVFGCNTGAYNELIETRWACFRDLGGVLTALEEMKVNGVQTNGRTRALVEALRREVGDRNMWEESGEVWGMLSKIEELALKAPRRPGKQANKSKKGWSDDQEWKNAALKADHADDGWEFDRWSSRSKPRRPLTDKPKQAEDWMDFAQGDEKLEFQ